MADDYSRAVLRVSIAQWCQSLGWNSISQPSLYILSDILEMFISQIGETAHYYTEQFGRTEPNISDTWIAMEEMMISVPELIEYMKHVEPIPFAQKKSIPKYPVAIMNQDQLDIPRERFKDCTLSDVALDVTVRYKELEKRKQSNSEHSSDVYLETYLPLMDRVTAKEEIQLAQLRAVALAEAQYNASDLVKVHEQVDNLQWSQSSTVPLIKPGEQVVPPTGEDVDINIDVISSSPAKKSRPVTADEVQHSNYEMCGVKMSTTGLLSPIKGHGKMADSRAPPAVLSKASVHDDDIDILGISPDKMNHLNFNADPMARSAGKAASHHKGKYSKYHNKLLAKASATMNNADRFDTQYETEEDKAQRHQNYSDCIEVVVQRVKDAIVNDAEIQQQRILSAEDLKRQLDLKEAELEAEKLMYLRDQQQKIQEMKIEAIRLKDQERQNRKEAKAAKKWKAMELKDDLPNTEPEVDVLSIDDDRSTIYNSPGRDIAELALSPPDLSAGAAEVTADHVLKDTGHPSSSPPVSHLSPIDAVAIQASPSPRSPDHNHQQKEEEEMEAEEEEPLVSTAISDYEEEDDGGIEGIEQLPASPTPEPIPDETIVYEEVTTAEIQPLEVEDEVVECVDDTVEVAELPLDDPEPYADPAEPEIDTVDLEISVLSVADEIVDVGGVELVPDAGSDTTLPSPVRLQEQQPQSPHQQSPEYDTDEQIKMCMEGDEDTEEDTDLIPGASNSYRYDVFDTPDVLMCGDDDEGASVPPLGGDTEPEPAVTAPLTDSVPNDEDVSMEEPLSKKAKKAKKNKKDKKERTQEQMEARQMKKLKKKSEKKALKLQNKLDKLNGKSVAKRLLSMSTDSSALPASSEHSDVATLDPSPPLAPLSADPSAPLSADPSAPLPSVESDTDEEPETEATIDYPQPSVVPEAVVHSPPPLVEVETSIKAPPPPLSPPIREPSPQPHRSPSREELTDDEYVTLVADDDDTDDDIGIPPATPSTPPKVSSYPIPSQQRPILATRLPSPIPVVPVASVESDPEEELEVLEAEEQDDEEEESDHGEKEEEPSKESIPLLQKIKIRVGDFLEGVKHKNKKSKSKSKNEGETPEEREIRKREKKEKKRKKEEKKKLKSEKHTEKNTEQVFPKLKFKFSSNNTEPTISNEPMKLLLKKPEDSYSSSSVKVNRNVEVTFTPSPSPSPTFSVPDLLALDRVTDLPSISAPLMSSPMLESRPQPIVSRQPCLVAPPPVRKSSSSSANRPTMASRKAGPSARGSKKVKAVEIIEEEIEPIIPAEHIDDLIGGQTGVVSETQGQIISETGVLIWICPCCKMRDDGSPMIGCDGCDDWYHWVCVGISKEPSTTDKWYCIRCERNKPKDKKKKKKKSFM